jgi:hypothetical protein
MSFLHQAAQQILADNPSDLHRVLVLMPNKRGEIFLKREMGKQLAKPALAPAMQTIEEFVQSASGYQKQSQLQLLIKLFGVYRQQVNPEESFDTFLKWGNTLLHDYNEIDRHLIDAYQLFGNLLDAKRIESWGVAPGNETDLMKNFLSFWRDLHPLYQAFHAALDAENLSYQGKAYRKVAEDVTLIDALLANQYTAIYLLGFNALNAAEELIFRHLISTHNATALWDADTYYLNDPMHEAGEFLRQYRDRWPEYTNRAFTWQQSLLASIPKKIQVLSAPTKQGMAQAAGRVLQNLPIEDAGQTALVLADEAMLLPVLDAIPANYTALNITMGLPIKHAAIAQDMLTVLRMQEQAERTKLGGSSYSYHHRTFLAVVESGLFRHLAGGQKTVTAITRHATQFNLVFLSPKKAAEVLAEHEHVPEVLKNLFDLPENADQLLRVLDEALMAYVAADTAGDALFNEAAFALHQLHEQARTLLADVAENLQTATLLRLYQSMLAEHQVDFYGEPLAGLQLMGMLETRTLDFKRVIITSLNEGILPTGKSQNSFIPFDLKVGFGMPTHNEKDAIYAYHFYRLLQRAEEVWLIYDSDAQGVGMKEKSRFVFQIENELAHKTNVSLLPTLHLAPEVNGQSLAAAHSFAKDEAVLARLRELAEKGFSPSALAAYLKDPAQFYILRLLKVDEADEVAETIGYDVLGNVVHYSLEQLYTPHVGHVLTVDALEEMLADAPKTVRHFLGQEYKGNLAEGRNLLISKVAQHMVEMVLKKDAERVQKEKLKNQTITIEALEHKMAWQCRVPGIDFPINFQGNADRIDRIGDSIYILDYKTGYISTTELKAESVAAIFETDKLTKAFQILFYAWMYAKTTGIPAGGLTAGIFSTRTPSNGFMQFGFGPSRGNKNHDLNETVLAEFETQLFLLIAELFEATKPFAQRLTITED